MERAASDVLSERLPRPRDAQSSPSTRAQEVHHCSEVGEDDRRRLGREPREAPIATDQAQPNQPTRGRTDVVAERTRAGLISAVTRADERTGERLGGTEGVDALREQQQAERVRFGESAALDG